MTLLSVGNILIDLTLRVDSLPEPGGDMLAESGGFAPGGAFNTLIAASRQGLAGTYGGGHGTGPFGDRVRSALAAEGIGVALEPDPNADTGFDVALVDGAGERTFVTAFGAEASVGSYGRIELADGDVVHASGYGLLDRTNAAVLGPWLEGLAGGTAVVLLDPGPLARDIRSPLLDRLGGAVDWFSCNLREAQQLTGDQDPDAASAALLARWSNVVLRLGPRGCLVNGERVEGFAVTAVDTNGAGDAHTGGFLAALAAGTDPLQAARRANAGAAIAVTRRGSATAPTAAEVDALLEA
jgi:sugar/nucleoside kinase (ribokinase family)